VKGNGLLLIDSGGQYFSGTTDITRVFALGKPTKEQIKNYTLVLKGHIKLASVKFPFGTSGSQLDCLARICLWNEGLDYQHGTGHGVGSFLNVHEGPYGINKISSLPLEKNVILSIEPGYYKAGEYGIRIENLYYIEKSKTKDFFEFKPLTLFPFEDELINYDMLDEREKVWLKNYNKIIKQTI
jgi:Xaa-Pro aminopeptidase